MDEIKAHLDEKQEDGIDTRNSADSRSSVLDMFVTDREIQEVREIRRRSQEWTRSCSERVIQWEGIKERRILPSKEPGVFRVEDWQGRSVRHLPTLLPQLIQ